MTTCYCKKTDLLISGFLVVMLMFFLPQYQFTNAFIISGQAHFLLTYLYQFRIGKYSARSSWLYPLTAFAIISPLAAYHQFSFIVFISSMFLLHNFYDEMRVLGIEHKPIRTICVLPTLINLVAYGSFSKFAIGHDFLKYFLLALSLAVPISLLLRNDIKKEELYYDIYNAAFTTLAAISLFLKPTTSHHIWTYVVINHYMIWYIRMGRTFHAQGGAIFYQNLALIITVNAAVVALWLASNNSSSMIYNNFFSPIAFYVWTLLHLLVTFRPDDYLKLVNFLQFPRARFL